MKTIKPSSVLSIVAAFGIGWSAAPARASPLVNLVQNGSFEGPDGKTPSDWMIGGTAADNYLPVTIAYNQKSNYPYGAQGEAVPTDDAPSASTDSAGSYGVYFVSDKAKNLSLYQSVYLTPGSYAIGFDSYDTYNGNDQPHDAVLSAEIAGVHLADFNLSSVKPGIWSTHAGEATITTAGTYLVSFVFNTPDYPDHPDNSIRGGPYNAKDVVIDRAYVLATSSGGGTVISSVPIPATLPMFGATLLAFAAAGYSRRRRKAVAPT